MGFLSKLLLAAAPLALAQQTQPAGTPWPESTYPNATDPNAIPGAQWNQTSPPYYPSPWGSGTGNWSAAYAKAQAFVAQLTLTEKVNLTTGVGWEGEQCVGNTGAIPRIGFRGFCLQDSPLGVRDTDFNSAFPAGMNAAATWDRALMRQRGADMGAEHRGKGVDMQLGPVVGPLGRSPEAGRNWEGFAADPVLAGVAVYETVQGIQSSNVIACTKHFILNEQEHFRSISSTPPTQAISSNADDVTMHELYLWPFAEAVRAGTGAIMCSYNQVNNSYACQNSYTLNKLLKAELGFQGVVVSDWSAQHAGVSSALAGLDMTMPGDVGFDTDTSYFGANLTVAVLNGTVPQWRLDDMCVRIMAAYYYVGRESVDTAPNFSSWFSRTDGYRYYYSDTGFGPVNEHVDVQGDHAITIREIGAKSTVLLKNNGVLPLSAKDIRMTAVIGYDAGPNPYGPDGCGDRGCDNGTLAMGWGSGTANFPYLVTPAEAIEGVAHAAGQDVQSIFDNFAYAQIQQLSELANDVGGVCMVFANADSGEGYITVDNNAGDRNNLTLWGEGNDLVNAVTAYCNNTVVVMHTVGPVTIESWVNNPNVTAILWAGLPGQESGNSLVDVLYGDVNPSGKLPFTLGSYRGQYGTDIIYVANNGDNAPQDNFMEGPFIDYRVFDKLNETPIYEFGYGLSYTTFEYSDIEVQQVSTAPYKPTSGQTDSAPTYGTIDNSTSDYVFPSGFNKLKAFIYSYLTSDSLEESSGDPDYGVPYDFGAGSSDSSPQPLLPASGAPGGNPGLWDVLFRVSATVKNTGSVAGEEVAQLYLALGGDAPKVQLRNFDKQMIQPGQSVTYTFDVTRKDLSRWNTDTQDWCITSYAKTAYVGSSSRKLPLSAPINVTPYGCGSSYPVPPSNSTSSYSYPGYPTSSGGYSSSGSMSASASTSCDTSSGPASYTSTGMSYTSSGPASYTSSSMMSSSMMSSGPASYTTSSMMSSGPASYTSSSMMSSGPASYTTSSMMSSGPASYTTSSMMSSGPASYTTSAMSSYTSAPESYTTSAMTTPCDETTPAPYPTTTLASYAKA